MQATLLKYVAGNPALFGAVGSAADLAALLLARQSFRGGGRERLTWLLFRQGEPQPAWVARHYASPRWNDLLEQEFTVCQALAAALPAPAVQPPLALAVLRGQAVFFEGWFEGRPLPAELARQLRLDASPPAVAALVREHFAAAQRLRRALDTLATPAQPAELEAELLALYETAHGRLAGLSAAEAELVAAARDALLPLSAAVPPRRRVLHLDFVPDNILRTAEAERLIDWEYHQSSTLWFHEPLKFAYWYVQHLGQAGLYGLSKSVPGAFRQYFTGQAPEAAALVDGFLCEQGLPADDPAVRRGLWLAYWLRETALLTANMATRDPERQYALWLPRAVLAGGAAEAIPPPAPPRVAPPVEPAPPSAAAPVELPASSEPAVPTDPPAPTALAAPSAPPPPPAAPAVDLAALEALQARVGELEQQLAGIHATRAWKVMSRYWQAAIRLKRAGRWLYQGVRAQGRRWLPLRLRSWVVQHWRRSIARRPVPPPAAPPFEYAPPRKADVIFFGIIDWSFRFQRPQQLALQFARNGHRCFYVSVRFHGAGPAPKVTVLAEGVYQVQLPGPADLKVYQGPLGAAQGPMLAALDALRRAAGLVDAFCFVQLPFWAPLALAAREQWGWQVIYDCMDEHSGFSNVGPAVADGEASLIKQSDLVLATSRNLYAKVSPAARRALLVPNASDFEHFHQPASAQPLAHLRGPVIGYYGAIAEWFDVDLVAHAAEARPGWHFVLIGHTFGADLRRLERLPNVHLLGEKPYSELPAYLQRFDVACIPFKLNALTAATNPVKFYEYLSAGKPVVSTALPELEPYCALYYPMQTGADFVAQTEAALRENSPERVAARLECARANTWPHRFATLQAALPDLYGRAVVVIVSFGSLDYLRQCLDSVFEKTLYPNFHVVVVDNASEPAVIAYLAQRAQAEPRLQVILNDTNQGFARANNQGIAAAGPCEYVVLLNNDTVVTRGWLGRLVGYLRHPQVGLVGPVTNAIGNEAQVDLGAYALADLDRVAAAYQQAHDGESFDIPVLAMYCVGVRRALLDQVGLLDERYVVGMFEDDDFALRVRRAGYRVLCANDIFVHHWMRASFKRLPPAEYAELFQANRQRYEEKWGRPWQPHQGRQARSLGASGRLAANSIAWRCNICGQACHTPLASLQPELPTCPACRSSVRQRAIVHLLSTELFGESLPLADFPTRPELRGVGLSDWEPCAGVLARKFSYTNTFFHQPPRLDLTAIDPALAGTLDFLIATEVFEHVAPPVARAFANARRLLKPSGRLLLSVPYNPEPPTGAVDARVEQAGQPGLRNADPAGRAFSEQGLRASLAEAGFGHVHLHGEPFFEHGVYWPQPWSLPIVARPG